MEARAIASAATHVSRLMTSVLATRAARDIFEKQKVRSRRDVNAFQAPLRHGHVSLVPKTDIGHFARYDFLYLAKELLPLLVIGRDRALLDEPIDLGVVEVAAVVSGRRCLPGVKHTTKDVR